MTTTVPGGALRGLVVSHDGWPLPDATVTVLDGRGGQAGRAVSDERGGFTVPVLPVGPVTVLVTAAGCEPGVVTALVAPGRSTDVGPVVLTGTGARELPRPGVWAIDNAHSSIRATARHLALTRVEGRFTRFTGCVVVADPPEASRCEVDIEAASITTDNDQRDEHLRSPDFLDAQRFPLLTYRSTGVTSRPADTWIVDGDLTIRDITRPVPLEVRFVGVGADAWGGSRAAFEATAMLARRDYEMRWNLGLPGGLTMLGPTLRIDLEIQVVRQDQAP